MPYPDIAHAVRRVELALRHLYGIQEFTDDEECIFRVALALAPKRIRLSDGTEIAAGDPVLQLHFWNEHLPTMELGPSTAWANRFRRAMRNSLVSVAMHVGRNAAYDEVRAFYGYPPFGSRIGAIQMVRTAQRFGFDVIDPGAPPDLSGRCYEVLDSVMLWGLAYVFNPAALRSKSLIRRRHELWISRQRLTELYGPGAMHRSGAPPSPSHSVGETRPTCAQ